MWGAWLFLAISLCLGYLTYLLIKRLTTSRSSAGNEISGRGAGIVFGGGVAFGMFVAFYASSLAGFYDLQIRGDHVVLHYLFPDRYVTRPAMNLLKADKEPAFKSKWRLIVHDIDGGVYQSALSSQRDVQLALNALQPVLDPEPSPRP